MPGRNAASLRAAPTAPRPRRRTAREGAPLIDSHRQLGHSTSASPGSTCRASAAAKLSRPCTPGAHRCSPSVRRCGSDRPRNSRCFAPSGTDGRLRPSAGGRRKGERSRISLYPGNSGGPSCRGRQARWHCVVTCNVGRRRYSLRPRHPNGAHTGAAGQAATEGLGAAPPLIAGSSHRARQQ
jgi:hypothetical protein